MKRQMIRVMAMAGMASAVLLQAGTRVSPPVPTCYPCVDQAVKLSPPVPTCYPCLASGSSESR